MNYIKENKNSNYDLVIEKIFNDRKKEIFSFFNSAEIDLPFNIYIYNSLENLVDGLRKRGFSKEFPQL